MAAKKCVMNGKETTWQGGKWIRPEKRLALHLRDGFTCVYCGTDLKDAEPGVVQLDHLVCRSAGGTNDATNLVTACRHCNSSRQDRSLEDFAPGGALIRIEALRYQALNLPLAKAIMAGELGTETH